MGHLTAPLSYKLFFKQKMSDKGAIEGVTREGYHGKKKRKEYEQVFRRGKACGLGLYIILIGIRCFPL